MLFNYNCDFFLQATYCDDRFVGKLLQAYKNSNYMEKDLHWANKAIVLKLYGRQLCLVVKKHIEITIIRKGPALG